MLLFPCQEFDCAPAFAYVTQRLAHEGVGHITELNPSDDYSLHCQGRVIQQINAARGSMRGKIVAGLFDPLNEFCRAHCPGREASIAAYLEGVKRTAIWPIENQHRKANKDILNSPGFTNWQVTIPPNACTSCIARLSGAHLRTIDRDNTNYWQGLCLDCMDISKTKARDLDSEYWEHARDREYSEHCRIWHERST
ncbi:hypothetical protein B0J14DRAFT_578254 [Halenospora varia]|nr:hypothetical protein B0J14DRAFT_578254 [Halenospora varia]